MNDIDKIKAKIKKLLALSGSPNPNEAASALKMAHELMAEYGVGQSDVNTIDIGEEGASTARRRIVPRYEARLFGRIADAFGCEVIHSYGTWCSWRFVGLRHRAQVAAYIGQILLRKLVSARACYVKSLYRVRSRSRKTRRADDYCLAWVNAVTEKLPAFAGARAEEQKAIALYKNKTFLDLEKLGVADRSAGNAADYRNGARAGGDVRLRHGVGALSRAPLLTGG